MAKNVDELVRSSLGKFHVLVLAPVPIITAIDSDAKPDRDSAVIIAERPNRVRVWSAADHFIYL